MAQALATLREKFKEQEKEIAALREKVAQLEMVWIFFLNVFYCNYVPHFET